MSNIIEQINGLSTLEFIILILTLLFAGMIGCGLLFQLIYKWERFIMSQRNIKAADRVRAVIHVVLMLIGLGILFKGSWIIAKIINHHL